MRSATGRDLGTPPIPLARMGFNFQAEPVPPNSALPCCSSFFRSFFLSVSFLSQFSSPFFFSVFLLFPPFSPRFPLRFSFRFSLSFFPNWVGAGVSLLVCLVVALPLVHLSVCRIALLALFFAMLFLLLMQLRMSPLYSSPPPSLFYSLFPSLLSATGWGLLACSSFSFFPTRPPSLSLAASVAPLPPAIFLPIFLAVLLAVFLSLSYLFLSFSDI